MSVSTSECPDDPESNNCGKAWQSHFNSPLLYIYGGFYKWRCTPKTLDGLFPGKSHLEMDEYPYFRKPVFVQDFF